MSNLNIFMTNKFNSYSWIHSLNNAALNAKLLFEAEQYKKQIDLQEARRGTMGGGQYREAPDRGPSEEEQAAANVGRFLKDIGFNKETLMKNASSIVGVGKDITVNPDPETSMITKELGKKDLKVSDVDNDGDADAQDVSQDASDNIMGNETSAVDPDLMKRYKSLKMGTEIGRQARMEAYAVTEHLNRYIKSLPPGRIASIQELKEVARKFKGI